MRYSFKSLGFVKTAKLKFKPNPKLVGLGHPLNQSELHLTRNLHNMNRALTPSRPSPKATSIVMPKATDMFQGNRTMNILSDLYKRYADYQNKVVNIPITTKKHKGNLSLGNVFGGHPNDPNRIKGFRYT